MAGTKKTEGNFLVRLGKRSGKWLRELKAELKKVIWPTPKQIVKNTWVVIVTVLIVSLVVSLFGVAANQGIRLLIGLAG
jgi:preprotein translocase subunit SecE